MGTIDQETVVQNMQGACANRNAVSQTLFAETMGDCSGPCDDRTNVLHLGFSGPQELYDDPAVGMSKHCM